MIEPKKGKSLLKLPKDYTVIDLETTGLSPGYDRIIEFAAVKCRDDKIVDKFSSLAKTEYVSKLSNFIEELTGITQEMLDSAPPIKEVLGKFVEFVGDDIVIAHNANFDINFICRNCEHILERNFENNFVDTLRIARRACPKLKSHRLQILVEHFGIEQDSAHRALSDCEVTLKCYKKFKNILPEDFEQLVKKRSHKKTTANKETANKAAGLGDLLKQNWIDLERISEADNPLKNKVCVFTGKLEKMTRAQASELTELMGGKAAGSVTKNTNILILGNNDYCKTIKDGKSRKHKAAEELILNGADLQIMPEDVFYSMIEDCQKQQDE